MSRRIATSSQNAQIRPLGAFRKIRWSAITISAANEAEISLAESGVFLLLNKNKPLTFREWTSIRHVVNDKLPAFSQLLLSKKKMLNDEEHMLCLLFRLHCTQKEICILMDMKQSSVSKHASAIFMKLFNENGGSKMLQHHLEQFC